jgi:hypothetical protein
MDLEIDYSRTHTRRGRAHTHACMRACMRARAI